MNITTIRNSIRRTSVALFFVLSVTGCTAQKSQPTMAQKQEALRSLRDSGVISEQEYNERLARLQGQGSTSRPASLPSSSGSTHTGHMKKVKIQNMTGWDAIPAYGIPARPQHQVDGLTMLIPTDWQFQGAPKDIHPGDCNFTQGRFAFFALSPDKSAGLISMPHPVSIWSNDPSILQQVQADNRQFAQMQNCRVEKPQPLAQQMPALLEEFAKAVGGGKLHAAGPMEPVPGVAEKLKPAVAQANQKLAPQGAQIAIEVGRIPIRDDNASDTGEGYLTVMQQVRTDRLPSGATVWTVDYPMQVATFAPQGKYASMDPMFAAMMDSVQLDPVYQQDAMQASLNIQSIKQQTKQRLNQIANAMQLDNINAARQQAAIRQDAQNYAGHVYSSVAANRSAALEHSSQQFSLYMGDQAQYHDPNGGIVQVPSGADHVWASQTGNSNEYILTNSASYNPNGNVGSSSWTEMKEVR